MNKKYDIIVAGGGTAGCAAAYTAGKSGLKTLLVEKNIHLGGAITSALVVPCMNANVILRTKSEESQNKEILRSAQDDCNCHCELVLESINQDFFNALVNELQKLGGQITYQGNKGWFNPELTKIALDNMMNEAGVDVLFSSKIVEVNTDFTLTLPPQEGGKKIISSLTILSAYNDKLQKELSEPIETRYVIDATGNCDVGQLSGCEFLDEASPSPQPSPLRGEGAQTQPVSLRFMMNNVDLKAFSEWILELDKDRNVTTVEYIDRQIHLSTAYTWDSGKNWALKPFFDDAVSKGVLKDPDRNYFQIFTVAGMSDTVAFNCPRMVENTDYSNSLTELRQMIYRLSEFCKIYLKGFENAFISNIADELGIRVSKRIKGKYIYTENDLLTGKHFEHPVLISNYPIDVHSKDKNASTLQKTGYYELPVESLMSADIENLFVVGRCISADFKAQGALRIQPNCFSMGEGAIKWIIENGKLNV